MIKKITLAILMAFPVLQSLAQAPDENRFVKSVLVDKLDEPMEFTFLPDGRILFVERKGDVKSYNTKTKETAMADQAQAER